MGIIIGLVIIEMKDYDSGTVESTGIHYHFKYR